MTKKLWLFSAQVTTSLVVAAETRVLAMDLAREHGAQALDGVANDLVVDFLCQVTGTRDLAHTGWDGRDLAYGDDREIIEILDAAEAESRERETRDRQLELFGTGIDR